MLTEADLLEAHILVVDDKPANVLLLEQLLRDTGYRQVSSTQDPYAVNELHRIHRYDLILLDLQMPGMDGFEVMAGLRDIEPGSYVPILAITVQPTYKLRALANGAQDFIAKPFDQIELKARIRNMLEVRLLYRHLLQAVNTLESFALHDALTGLPNRRLLLERLTLCRATSTHLGHHMALMFLDLDHFKLLNDTLGHNVGDVLLQQVGERLQSCLRTGDSVAHFGGDEFVVLLDALSPQAQAAAAQANAVAHKIHQTLDRSYSLNGHTYENTVSIGVVAFQGDAEPVSRLLKMADMAMYRAKSLGRDRVCLFTLAMQAEEQAREDLINDMRRALNAHEFVQHYQVVVDAKGVPQGAGAVLRWNHPRLGLLQPEQFLVLAEDSNLLLPLAQWALQSACQQLLAWANIPPTANWKLLLNITACQLAQADFAAQVAHQLQASGASAQHLTLVLGEDTLQGDMEDMTAKINTLRVLGVEFCLEAFGVDFASLACLKRLPLVQLKINQTVVHAVHTDASMAVIARAIVALAQSLGLLVLVAGVDGADQRDFFAHLGCDAFQGDFFAPAVPSGELAAL